MRHCFYFSLLFVVACVSTQNTIQNIDATAPRPILKNDRFVLTDYATDPKYGYNEDFPVNVFYNNANNDSLNAHRFLRSLTGPKGETISFKKVDICCPYSSKNSSIGGAYLAIYEVTYEGLSKPKQLYINLFEPGVLLVPIGFETIKE